MHEPLEPVEPGEVEVVGRLVEQEDVEPREQDRRDRGPRRLAAREACDRLVESRCRQPDVGHDLADAGVEVRRPEREPAFEADRVRVVGARLVGGERGRCADERVVRSGDARTPVQQLAHRLAVSPFDFLGQVAHGRRRRREAYRSVVGLELAPKQP